MRSLPKYVKRYYKGYLTRCRNWTTKLLSRIKWRQPVDPMGSSRLAISSSSSRTSTKEMLMSKADVPWTFPDPSPPKWSGMATKLGFFNDILHTNASCLGRIGLGMDLGPKLWDRFRARTTSASSFGWWIANIKAGFRPLFSTWPCPWLNCSLWIASENSPKTSRMGKNRMCNEKIIPKLTIHNDRKWMTHF